MTIEEIERRRSERKAAAEKLRLEQYAKDLEALDALEQEHGEGRVHPVHMSTYSAGLPTMVIVRVPEEMPFKRFRDKVRKSKGQASGDATDELATVCRLYPDEDTYAKMQKAWPGVHDTVGHKVITLAQGKADEQGKD